MFKDKPGNGSEGITIYEIAREAGVSTATVSRILTGHQKVSNEKRVRVEALIEKYNFTPNSMARNLSSGKSRILGFIQPDIEHPYYAKLYTSAERRAAELGYSIFLGNTLNDNSRHINNLEMKYLRQMQEKKVDGIMIAGGRLQDIEHRREYESELKAIISTTPIVSINTHMPWIDCPSVKTNEEAGIIQMMDYFVSLGHTDIGFIGGVEGIDPSAERLQSMRIGLEKNGLVFSEEWHIGSSGFSAEDGRIALSRFLKLDNMPTAVLCFNDLVAIGFINEAHNQGLKIPEDISVAGIDNIAFGDYLIPSLTTVDLKAEEQGRRGAEIMVDYLNKQIEDHHSVIEPRLILRNSCSKKSG
ncbi:MULTISPECIES: LacI family DNA-binding transcriptional regulator [unclassified Oceanispirochaeta]|uniref:LacI family DNA-binding transcriptional regulator n=1 Tax=unclassified Oceanispirochaeta TaxID=2635722 RepID=UPI000E09C3D0|nr:MULTISPECIES: LacI family DNA-binding transcriptional regulator [unclassified Oceanispirochaeta]MBF9015339.1 LacI family DNA-binding transcriptional regulator [Oceanispirochaeta sp. M2]NPD71797.1 LacI family transcriptional regulator [Oceanispirochaeta sp. M1]RDG32986.1 LacI family transcriptional regulator [Oceanispirochaeta sp. M1]